MRMIEENGYWYEVEEEGEMLKGRWPELMTIDDCCRGFQKAEIELRKLRAAAKSWIEGEPPKDGREYLAGWSYDKPHIVYWCSVVGCWKCAVNNYQLAEPEFWMSLPDDVE